MPAVHIERVVHQVVGGTGSASPGPAVRVLAVAVPRLPGLRAVLGRGRLRDRGQRWGRGSATHVRVLEQWVCRDRGWVVCHPYVASLRRYCMVRLTAGSDKTGSSATVTHRWRWNRDQLWRPLVNC